MIKIECISNKIFETNSYIIYESSTGQALVLDPSFDPVAIHKKCLQLKVDVIGVLVTHGHQDHIFGVNYFVEQYNCKIFASKQTKELFTDRIENLSYIGSSQLGLEETLINHDVVIVKDGQEVVLGDFTFRVGVYPGHSRGCTIFDFGDFLMMGDFIFKGTIGRVDWPGSNPQKMIENLQRFIGKYKDTDILMFSGHNETTTTAIEFAENLFLKDVNNVLLI